MRFYLAVVALLLIASAGCVNVSTFANPVQQTSSSKTDVADMIQIGTATYFPTPIEPGDKFTLQFSVENIHEKDPVYGLKCYISDPGIFKSLTPDPAPQTLYPKTKVSYEFDFSVPSSDVLTNEMDSSIEFICTHKGHAESLLQYSVFDKNTLDQYQLSGKQIQSFKATTEYPGPLKIHLEPGSNYFITSRNGKINVEVENIGSYGIVGADRRNIIEPGRLHVLIEEAQTGSCSNIHAVGPGTFKCHESLVESVNYCNCTNSEQIRMYESKSPQMSFVFPISGNAAKNGRKTYAAKADLDYRYYVRKSVVVNVQEP